MSLVGVLGIECRAQVRLWVSDAPVFGLPCRRMRGAAGIV
jgi:hypothetical protein